MRACFAFFAVVALLPLVSPAWAERADRAQPMQIEADNMQHDEPKQLTVLTGRVQASKGTLLMRAQRMEVKQEAQGQQTARFWAKSGERIFFRQKREGLDEFIEGQAVAAVYDSAQDLMTLSGNAEVRILRQGQVSQRIQGQRIVYNNASEVLQVEGAPPQAGSGKDLGGGSSRVRAVLTPRQEPLSGEPVAPAAPTLRSSPRLGSGAPP